jgi:membrane-bound metal-dependent hydrolase YbcI (DUF457 family)
MDLLFHMLIPVMLAWISGVDRKKALMLAPVAIIPDLDVLFAAHRVYLHTLFIPIAIAAVSFLYKFKRQNHQKLFLLVSLYYLSHLLLDFFPGPVAILWPLTNIGYGLDVGVTVSQRSNIPVIEPHLAVTVEQISVPNLITEATALTPHSVVVAIFLLTVMIVTQREKILHIRK